MERSSDERSSALDDSKYKIGKTLEAHPEIEFVYDFGDDWRHKIIFEDFVLPDFEQSYPICIADENHQEYKDMTVWEAFENQNYSLAETLWEDLIENESDPDRKDKLLSGYCYTLCKLGKYEIAHIIYENLYHKTSDHIYLHQLAMVARERGHFSEALNYILKEKELIFAGKTSLPLELALGGNSYEAGKLQQLLGDKDEAFEAAEECLYYAMSCDDKIMLACAFRLLGDIEALRDKSASKIFYEMAIAAFDDAGDHNGILEIEKILFF